MRWFETFAELEGWHEGKESLGPWVYKATESTRW